MSKFSKDTVDNINTPLSFITALVAFVQLCLKAPWYVYAVTFGAIALIWIFIVLSFLHRRPWYRKMSNPLMFRTKGNPYPFKYFYNTVYRKPYYEIEYISPKYSNRMNKNHTTDIDTSRLTVVVEDDPVGYADNIGMLPCIPLGDEISWQELYDKLVEIDSDINVYNFLFIATPSRRLDSAKAFTLCREIGIALRNYLEKYHADKNIRLISKIDSCLRSNYEAEYEGLTDGLGKRECIEMLIPSYVEQNRVTIHGCQYIKENEVYKLMHESEYSSFKGLEYSNSNLALWLEKRVSHIGDRKAVGLVDIDVLRSKSPDEVTVDIVSAVDNKITAFVVDTVERNDLVSVAKVIKNLEATDHTLFLKLGPSMINLIAATYAKPRKNNSLSGIHAGDKAIIVAGSLTSTTKKQIECYDDFPDTSIVTIKESDLNNIFNVDEIIVKRSNNIIKKNNNGDNVILTTEYWKTDKNEYPDVHKRDIVLSLIAKICQKIRVSDDLWFLFKGSDTALYSIINGLDINYFYYCGQYIPGVIHCKCHYKGALKSFFIVGGNVGAASLLNKLKIAIEENIDDKKSN